MSIIDIAKHPIWKGIDLYKKPAHILRIHLARQFCKLFPKSIFIGITGSVGKTTTAHTSLAVLSQKYYTLVTKPNLDPILNIPITILKVRPKVQKVILEMGVEFPGEMEFYLSLVRPQTVIVTRIFFAHSQFLGGINEITAEKAKLVEQLDADGVAILNWDDIYSRKLADRTTAQVIFFGTDSNNCNVWAGNIRINNLKTVFELNYGVERVEVVFNLLGKHQVYAALAAAALGISNGQSLVSIKKGLETVEPQEHRLQIKKGHNNSLVLDDTYNNASPVGLEEALNVLSDLPARRRIAVLGEMRELGEYSEELHRRIAQKIYQEKLDLVFLGGGEVKHTADELIKLGFSAERMESNLTNSQIVSKILRNIGKGDIVLVKGSRLVRMDEIIQRITVRN